MTKMKTKLLHLKFLIFGDTELKTKGKMIPCKECDKLFKSYTHFRDGGYVYDSLCDLCKNKKEVKNGKREYTNSATGKH